MAILIYWKVNLTIMKYKSRGIASLGKLGEAQLGAESAWKVVGHAPPGTF